MVSVERSVDDSVEFLSADLKQKAERFANKIVDHLRNLEEEGVALPQAILISDIDEVIENSVDRHAAALTLWLDELRRAVVLNPSCGQNKSKQGELSYIYKLINFQIVPISELSDPELWELLQSLPATISTQDLINHGGTTGFINQFSRFEKLVASYHSFNKALRLSPDFNNGLELVNPQIDQILIDLAEAGSPVLGFITARYQSTAEITLAGIKKNLPQFYGNGQVFAAEVFAMPEDIRDDQVAAFKVCVLKLLAQKLQVIFLHSEIPVVLIDDSPSTVALVNKNSEEGIMALLITDVWDKGDSTLNKYKTNLATLLEKCRQLFDQSSRPSLTSRRNRNNHR